MADNDDEEEGPLVELGSGDEVEGAPIARVASRLQWPAERGRIEQREGDTVVRTPEGPRTVADVLDETDTTYFDRRQTFVEEVRDAVGRGPIPTADEAYESEDEATEDVDETDESAGDEADETDAEEEDADEDAEDEADETDAADTDDAADDQ